MPPIQEGVEIGDAEFKGTEHDARQTEVAREESQLQVDGEMSDD